MTHGILIQARMGSTRLPGKVLMDLCGEPVLHYILTHACDIGNHVGAPSLSSIVVCIPDTLENDVLAEWVISTLSPFGLYRGSEHDVAGRLLNAALEWGLDSFVRLCADSPLIDPKLVRQAGLKGCYPAGQQAQYIYTDTLRRRYPHMTEYEHEHVVNRTGETWAAGPSFTLDTPGIIDLSPYHYGMVLTK